MIAAPEPRRRFDEALRIAVHRWLSLNRMRTSNAGLAPTLGLASVGSRARPSSFPNYRVMLGARAYHLLFGPVGRAGHPLPAIATT